MLRIYLICSRRGRNFVRKEKNTRSGSGDFFGMKLVGWCFCNEILRRFHYSPNPWQKEKEFKSKSLKGK